MTEAQKEQMSGTTDEEEYWQAVQTRDGRFDGSFVYAVHSTGIYCRPSCPARRPGREQVTFFALPEGAERAGFRACRRCRPRETAVGSPQVEMARRACRWIETHLDEALSLSALGTQLGVSPHHMQRTFKRVMSITPRQYAEACRLHRLKARLREGETVMPSCATTVTETRLVSPRPVAGSTTCEERRPSISAGLASPPQARSAVALSGA